MIATTIGNGGVNLHGLCERVLILDLPNNIHTLLQMGGILARVGQRVKSVVEILGTARTFDVARQGILATEFLSTLARQISFDTGPSGSKDMPPEEMAISHICEEVIRRVLGQTSSRMHWKATGESYSKDDDNNNNNTTVNGKTTDTPVKKEDEILAMEREDFKLAVEKANQARKSVGKGLKFEIDRAGK